MPGFLSDEQNVIRIGLLLSVVAAYFSTGTFHADEHYQILEFAGVKIGTTTPEQMPWEYSYLMRPSLQPFIAIWINKVIGFLSEFNPFLLTFVLRLMAAGLAFFSSWILYKYYIQTIENQKLKQCLLWMSFLLWFLIYTHVRFSSENISGAIFLLGFVYYLKSNKENPWHLLGLGILFGMAIVVRVQVGLLVLGLGLWMVLVNKESIRNIIFLSLGGTFAIALGFILDSFFYEKWVLTIWNYFESNIINDRASAFGRHPWWQYINDSFFMLIPPFSILFIVALFSYPILKRKDPVTWAIVPFILVHFLIAHKELRFFMPIVGFIPIMTVRYLEWINRKLPDLKRFRLVKLMTLLFWISNFVLVIVVLFKSNDHRIALYESIYKYDYPLYGYKVNPYSGSPDICFFQRAKSKFFEVDSAEELKVIDNQPYLVVTKGQKIPDELQERAKMVYCTFPDWMKIFNFNHWMERTSTWELYLVGNQQKNQN